jgi:hypothetical protein
MSMPKLAVCFVIFQLRQRKRWGRPPQKPRTKVGKKDWKGKDAPLPVIEMEEHMLPFLSHVEHASTKFPRI